MADNNFNLEAFNSFLENQERFMAPVASPESGMAEPTATTTTHKEQDMQRVQYDPDDFAGIPEPQCWKDVRDCLNAGVTQVLLYGGSGIGKTFAGITMGDVSRGVERLVCTEDMTTFNVGGGMIPNESGTLQWAKGAALRAWVNGSRLIIDEIDKAGGDVTAELLAFTDSLESASYIIPTTGETFYPQPGFSVVMTSNIENPDELPPALVDRFRCAIQIDAPHPSALMQFPQNQRMLAATLCSGPKNERVSLRQMMFFNQLLADPAFDLSRAARLAFTAKTAESIVSSLMVGTLTTEVNL
jgi:hypothetical protein